MKCFKMRNTKLTLTLMASVFAILISFENCGPGFQVSQLNLDSNLNPSPNPFSSNLQLGIFAGSDGGSGSLDGPGSNARFNNPYGIAADGLGNLFVADSYNYTIRKIDTHGTVTTIAGQAGVIGSADSPGSAARFNSPLGIAADGLGNLFVADSGNNTIRKIDTHGAVTTIAGQAGVRGSVDGPGSAARFNSPNGIAADGLGNLFVADSGNNTIRKIDTHGTVTTIAGQAGVMGSADGPGSAARFYYPLGIAADGLGNLFVADSAGNSTIRKIDTHGTVTTIAGQAGVMGSEDGPGSAARFSSPWGIAVDGLGNLFVADSDNHTIRKIDTHGTVTTIAGQAGATGSADGPGSAARFNYPVGIAADGLGNLFVADSYNYTIRKIDTQGTVTTIAGQAGVIGSADGPGSAARFSSPWGIAADGLGNLFVADSYNHTIRKIDTQGTVTTIAGQAGVIGSADGPGSTARFTFPGGIAADGLGNLFVADSSNRTIRKIDTHGTVTTIAGQAGAYGSADGPGSTARFNYPVGIAADGLGNLFVADSGNNTIRKIDTQGTVTTIAGQAGVIGSADGPGSAARFNDPNGIAADGLGNLFVADSYNSTIRKIDTHGTVTTIAGESGKSGLVAGNLPGSLPMPLNLTIFGNTIFVSSNFCILHITP